MRVSLYESHTDNAPAPLDLEWAELRELLSDFPEPRCAPATCGGRECSAKYREAWSPAEVQGTRANANVLSVCALVLDLDHVSDAEVAALEARLLAAGLAYQLHTTHSHGPADGSWRLVLPLDRPALPREYARVRRAYVEALGAPADPQCSDLGRLYFLPTRREGAPWAARGAGGSPLPVGEALVGPEPARAAPTPAPAAVDLGALREALARTRRSKAHSRDERQRSQAEVLGRVLDGAPLAEAGARDGTVLRACGLLAYWLPAGTPWPAALELLRPSLGAMPTEPEGLDHWVAVAADKFARQAEARARDDGRRSAEAAAARALMRRLGGGAAPSPEQADAAAAEAGGDWADVLLVDERGRVRPCEHNARSLLALHPELRGTVCWDEALKRVEVRGGPLAGVSPAVLDTAAAGWLQRECEFFGSSDLVGRCLAQVARENARDPLAEYLGEAAWDGVPRLDGFLERYFGVSVTSEDGRDVSAHVRRVSRRWLVALAARALRPGCKVDNVLILEGDEGLKKSTALEALVGPEYFVDTSFAIGDKDAMQLIASAWLVELAELADFRRAEAVKIRQFVSSKVDKFRPPYGKVVEESPRRCVFAGTCNPEEGGGYLRDRFNRRYWPVRVTQALDLEAVRRDRDVVLAEAAAAFRSGERWWLEPHEYADARAETDARVEGSSALEALERWWYGEQPQRRPRRFSVLDAAEMAMRATPDRVGHRERTEIGRALAEMGFERRGGGGNRVRYYEPGEALLSAPVRVTAVRAAAQTLAQRVAERARGGER